MIYLDFETYSPADISAGAYKYMYSKDADIVCLMYKLSDNDEVSTWTPNIDVPRDLVHHVKQGCNIYAYNAAFDYLAWNILASKYSFPTTPLSQWVDSMALANRYTLPGALAKAGEVLKLPIQKQKDGKALIKKICVPTKAGNRPVYQRDYSANEYMRFLEYCKTDVMAMYDLVANLPASKLSPSEQYYWEMTQRMNFKGLPVDISEINRIFEYIKSYAEEMTLRVPILTDGAVQKVTQLQRMRDWMSTLGVTVSNLQANTVETLLTQSIPDEVRELLVLRQTIGRSSTAKYLKLMNMEYDGYIHGNLQYHGTSTGRWAGRGFQLHNLPRASVPNPEETIGKFVNFEAVEDPVNVAKALIRPMIKAKLGELILVSDYSSIENRLLAFVAGDDKVIAMFKAGGDQYVEMAAYLYGVNLQKVTKAQRQIGKIIILGCGYQMGPPRFRETAKDWGVILSIQEARNAVDAYRSKYGLVKQLWGNLSRACISAIQYPGESFSTNGCTFRVTKCRAENIWLVLKLPSGRNLFYAAPYLSDGPYGKAPKHKGVNPYSKKWDGLFLSPGRITENVIQALARDIMAYGLRIVEERMANEVKLIGTVHDEAIAIIREDHDVDILKDFNKCLCTKEAWAAKVPLKAEGFISKRYRK